MSNLSILLTSVLMMTTLRISGQVYYLDEDYPGMTPQKYAENKVSVEGRYIQNITMSPDGKEILLGETDSSLWRYERILRIKVLDSFELVIDTPDFVKNFEYERMWMIGEPMISPDNRTLYFVADYPPDYWQAERSENGDWSNPTKLISLSTDDGDWYISISENNTLYYTDGRIHMSPKLNGQYTSRTLVEGAFNLQDAGDPCIAPAEDYMVFASTRKGGYGQGDIYVCFKDYRGNWSEAYDLGSDVNTEDWESAPYISPDEKYLFFSRRDTSQHAKYQDIYWVSMRLVDSIKNKNLQIDQAKQN